MNKSNIWTKSSVQVPYPYPSVNDLQQNGDSEKQNTYSLNIDKHNPNYDQYPKT